MFKRIELGGLSLRVWTDGYDNDPIGTATHAAIRSNAPGDDRIEDETDFFVLDRDTDIAWAYAKGMTTRHGGHNHRHYDVICETFDDEASHGDAAEDWMGGPIAGLFEEKGYDVRVGDPDQLPEEGVDATVPRSIDDFEGGHRLEGYGLTVDEGRPVFSFAASEDLAVPARWFPPLTHVVNYSFGETEAEAVQRMGVMDTENAIVGGWSGEDGLRLVRRLAEHEGYDIAVRVVPSEKFEGAEHAPGREPGYLGSIDYAEPEPGYRMVEQSSWMDARNEEGVTALEMWEEQVA